MDNIRKLIEPKSIAVIGASNDTNKVGYQLFNNIVNSGYKGKLYPVNKKKETILGICSVESISHISENIDLAIIVIPAQFVLGVIKECIAKGVSSLVIISSGFSESGPEGTVVQNEIVSLCEKANVSLLGPNCLGLINMDMSLNASFAALTPLHGNIGFISQSGAMVSALIDWSKENNVGLSKVFSTGNMAQIDVADLLEYLYSDQSTETILLYLESLNVNNKLTELLIKNAKKKSTIILFGGRTESGNTAAVSHTGAIVSSYKAIETYLNQAGVILTNGLNDFFFTTKLFSRNKTLSGNKVAIITNAGGPSIITCDALEKNNIPLATLSNSTVVDLVNNSRNSSSCKNPVDLLGDATNTDYKLAMDTVLKDKSVDALLVLITRQSSTDTMEIARRISAIKTNKAVLPIFIGDGFEDENNLLSTNDFACFNYPEEAVTALKHLIDYNIEDTELSHTSIKNNVFNIEDKFRSLDSYDLPALEYIKCINEKDIDNAALKLGFPMVAKTADPTIIHKSESGGVILNIENSFQLENAFQKLGNNIIVGKMLSGHEIFIGIKKDRNIGTIVAFGTGGIYSEIYDDFSYRVSPISIKTAKKMIYETKIGKILDGARGQESFNIDRLASIIVNTALLADSFSNIREIDFNPLIADKTGYFIVDARIILEKEF